MPDYTTFSADDFLNDDAFLNWVRYPTPENDQFWQNWLAQNPTRQSQVESARRVLLAMTFDGTLSASEKQQMWQHIHRVTQIQPTRRRPDQVFTVGSYWKYLRVAAVATGLLVLVVTGYEYLRHQPVTVTTGYSQLRHLTLPDGSAITLNAHSTLHYGRAWDANQTREVWLDGEAFFKVQHTTTNQKFIVHTPDLTVEVLGTEFDLFKRNGTTKIALATGRVKVSANNAQTQSLIMQPGDLVEFSARSKHLTRRPVNVTNYAAWTRKKLLFDETPVVEVIALLHDNYGFTVRLMDTSILTETISGEIQTDNEATLLRALGKALDVTITRSDKTLTIERIP